jgi:hypothetical protein
MNPANPPNVQLTAMRKTAWIWFVGCAVWAGDGVVQLRVHARPHAQLAFMLAMLFLVAGLFYRLQQR